MTAISGGYLLKLGSKGHIKINRPAVFLDKAADSNRPFYSINSEKFTLQATEKNNKNYKVIAQAEKYVTNTVMKGLEDKQSEKSISQNLSNLTFDVLMEDGSKQTFMLKQINTDPDFGGKLPGEGAGERAEKAATDSLNNRIKNIMSSHNVPYVTLRLPGIGSFKVTGAIVVQKQPGTANFVKSDINVLNEKGKSVIFISYKDNARRKKIDDNRFTAGLPLPSAFSQYSGVSESRSPEVAKMPQTKKFVDYLQARYKKTGVPKKMIPFAMAITGRYKKTLQKKAMFGLKYEPGGISPYGVDNCTMLLQGLVSLKQVSHKPLVYEFEEKSTNHIVYNTEAYDPSSDVDYEPILLLRTGRQGKIGDCGIPSARIGIFPRGGQTVKHWVTDAEINTFYAQQNTSKAKSTVKTNAKNVSNVRKSVSKGKK